MSLTLCTMAISLAMATSINNFSSDLFQKKGLI
jgi:hypothetical protein